MGVYGNLLMVHPLEPRVRAASPAELLESVGHHRGGDKCPAVLVGTWLHLQEQQP